MSPTVLFVDNEDVNQRLIEYIRRVYGLGAISADRLEAVAAARALWEGDAPPDAAVVDLSMPDPAHGGQESAAAGWDLIRWMQSLRPDALIAVLTTFADQTDAEIAKSLKVAIYRRDIMTDATMNPFWEKVAARARAGVPQPGPDDRQRGLDDDYWWGLSDPEVRRLHSGQVVAIHRRKVVGAGRDHLEALRTARRAQDCPDRKDLAFVVVPYAVVDSDRDLARIFKNEEMQRRYAGLVVAVHQQAILGAGNDREAAWRAAQRQPRCPAPDQVRYLLIPTIPDSPSP